MDLRSRHKQFGTLRLTFGFVLLAFMTVPAKIAIIPEPYIVETPASGAYRLVSSTSIAVPDSLKVLADTLAAFLRRSTGLPLLVRTLDPSDTSDALALRLDPSLDSLGEEGYRLVVNNNGVSIRSAGNAGLFYGTQTLRQLLPPAIESRQVETVVKWNISFVNITDKPRFVWRGHLLDLGRKFQTVDYLKKIMDRMALYKLNVLHFHCTEESGWRIPIPKYPLLIGGSYSKGSYTKEDIQDICAFAQTRGITVVPEIEMPGHAKWASTKYPQYFDARGNFLLNDDSTFLFIRDILTETVALFPSSPYLHIGTDECGCYGAAFDKFVIKVCSLVTSLGKIPMGWNEIVSSANSALSKNTWVQSWEYNGYASVADWGYNTIVSSPNFTYLDYSYARNPLQQIYSYDPLAKQTELGKSFIKGVETTTWGNMDLEYLVFPRLCANAEVAWSAPQDRQWDDFKSRIAIHGDRFDWMEINFCWLPDINWSYDYVIDRAAWKNYYVDSEDSVGFNYAYKAIDNDTSQQQHTYWQTRWSPSPDPMPHEIRIDMGRSYPVMGLGYLPGVKGDWNSGTTVKNFELYVSDDSTSWGAPAVTGQFQDIAWPYWLPPSRGQKVRFAPVQGRYLKFRALSAMNGWSQIKISELFALRVPEDTLVLTNHETPVVAPANISLAALPNPFNPSVNVAVSGFGMGAELKVLDISGRVVADLTAALNSGANRAGARTVAWNASGHASGVYLILLKDGKVELKRKAMLIW